ncbi:MAG: hypothetical protein ABGY11_15545 [Candidatus Thioglobus sp.]
MHNTSSPDNKKNTKSGVIKTRKEVMVYLITSAVSVLLLTTFAKSLSGYNCSLAFIISALVAWPIWSRLCESRLYARRLWTDGLLTKESWIRKFLRKGTLVKIYLAILSLIFALLLLSLVSLLKEIHYYILLIDVVLLVFAQRWITSRLSSHVKDKNIGLASRNFLYYGNIVILSIILASVDYSTYVESSKESFNNIFNTELTKYNCEVVGGISAFFSSIELKTNSWFFSYISEFNNSNFRFLMWLIFLMKSGMVIWLFNHFVLGSQLLIDKAILKPKRKESIGSKSFSITMIVLAMPYFILTLAPQPIKDDPTISQQIGRPIDICQSEGVGIESENLNNVIQQHRNDSQKKIIQHLEKTSNQAKIELSKNIDIYLDWYYSLPGEYQRLGNSLYKLMINDKEQLATDEEINKIISKPILDAYSSSITKINSIIIIPFTKLINTEFKSTDADVMRCIGNNTPGLTRDHVAAAGSATSGLVAARAIAVKSSTGIAKKVAATTVGKLLLKTTAKKGVSVAAGASTGALAGLVCGLAAPVCSSVGAVVGGVTAWVLVDTSVIKIDEYFNRGEMKQSLEDDLRNTIDNSIKNIKEQLLLELDRVIIKERISPINNQLITQ